MLYWMRVKAVDHPATSWECAPRERVPGASEHPCQREQSSGCCWWPLAATHRLASLRSDPTAFPDTFGLAESRTNPARGHDSSSNCGTETGASPSPQEPALRCRFSSGSDSRGHRDTSYSVTSGASAARSAPRAGRGAEEMHLRAGTSPSNNPEPASAASYFCLANCSSCPWMRRRNNLLYFSAVRSVPSRCRSGNKWWEGLASTNSLPRSMRSRRDFVLGPQIQARK